MENDLLMDKIKKIDITVGPNKIKGNQKTDASTINYTSSGFFRA